MREKVVVAHVVAMVGLTLLPAAVRAEDDNGVQPDQPPSSVPAVDLDEGDRGEDAIAAAGDRLGSIAADIGLTGDQLAAEFLDDDSLVLVGDDVMVIDAIDPADHHDDTPEWRGHSEDFAPRLALVDQDLPPLDRAFELHSRPNSDLRIYLDFFSSQYIDGAWDLDGDPSTFSDQEREFIVTWWQATAALFAPFDVDITTERPDLADLEKSSDTDPRFGQAVWVSHVDPSDGQVRGFASVGSFPKGDGITRPAQV